jgi:hypothetical protein
MSKVLAFDIGIRNLAFCVLENQQVLALQNISLIQEADPIHCGQCKVKASYQVGEQYTCKRHVPKTHQILPELSKKTSNKILKELVKTHECPVLGSTNERYLASLATRFALPVTQPKSINASKMPLEQIHDALRSFVVDCWPIFSGCTHVLLENQPAFKNPHMKSVQILLFATLREQFLSHGETPQYQFVHAKKKVSDAAKGDAGYAERKNKSEARLVTLFESGLIQGATWYEAWKAAKKQSDMADALCMAVDHNKIS